MTKKMGLMALGLSMALLSGCGSDDNNTLPTPPAPVDPNTPTEVVKNIVGTWMTGCVNGDNDSWTDTLTLNADGSGLTKSADYDAPGCNPADEVDSSDEAFTYTIGEATIGSDGEVAVELDAEFEWGMHYTMVHFDAVLDLYVADSDDINDGETPETRADDFDEDEPFTKQ